MRQNSFLKNSGSGCAITIDASPGAAKTEIIGVNRWRGSLQIKIAAEPRDGAANEELLRFLSRKLSVPRASLRIVKGERSSHKILIVPLPVAKVESILGSE